MQIILRNTQGIVKPQFAYCAMVDPAGTCDLRVMRIRLKEMREQLGLSQEAMAERIGISVGQISRWEGGKNNIPSDRLSEIAYAYRCRIADIFEEDDDTVVKLGPRLFVKGNVQAGHFVEAWEVPEDEWERYTGRADVYAPVSQRFGLRVVGESMNEIYREGTILDCVNFDGRQEIPNGKRVIVRRKRWGDGVELTVKQYHIDKNGVEWLVPRSTNPAFQAPFRFDEPGDEIEEISIIAIVVASIQPE